MPRRIAAPSAVLIGLLLISAAPARAQHTRQPVTLRVLLSQADTKLLIDEAPTKSIGTTRLFVSPPLEAGRTFTYTLSATWEPNGYSAVTRTRKVAVRAGQEVEVDLRQANDKEPDKIVIIFVPTPDEVVEAMCKLANVGKDDVVYDLGCGDGRIVLTAMQKFGARRGVGIDLNPERVKESKENAVKAGVADQVEFRQGDVLNIKDLADASVVMLYMGDDVNLRLRPILQKTLKPGSRIVSHEFLMGDWKPVKSIAVTDDQFTEYNLHLWIVGEKTK